MSKKTRTIVLILAAVLVIGIVAYFIVDAQQEARRKAEYEQRKIDVVMEVLQPYAEKYGFTDLVCNKANLDAMNVYAVVTSEHFGQATDEEKLLFLAEVEYATKGISFSSDDHLMRTISSHGLSLYVISGEYSYTETVSGKYSELRRADADAAYSTSAYSPYKEELLAMETPHSADVAASLDALLNKPDTQPDNNVCIRCDGTGKVTKHFGKSWNQKEGYILGGPCGLCGGSGIMPD